MDRNEVELQDGATIELEAGQMWVWPTAPPEDEGKAELIDTPTDAVRFKTPGGSTFEIHRQKFELRVAQGFIEPMERR